MYCRLYKMRITGEEVRRLRTSSERPFAGRPNKLSHVHKFQQLPSSRKSGKIQEETAWEGKQNQIDAVNWSIADADIPALHYCNNSMLNVVFEWVDVEDTNVAIVQHPPVVKVDFFKVQSKECARVFFEVTKALLPDPDASNCGRDDCGRCTVKVDDHLDELTQKGIASISYLFDEIIFEEYLSIPVLEVQKESANLNFQSHQLCRAFPSEITILQARLQSEVSLSTLPRKRQTKYFCKSCGRDICRECFTMHCLSHDVLWAANVVFKCVSPFCTQSM